jgi:hypothetical protein
LEKRRIIRFFYISIKREKENKMKNTTKKALAFIGIAALVLGIGACKEPGDDKPDPNSQVILRSGSADMTVDGVVRSVLIQGTFDGYQWPGILSKVQTAVGSAGGILTPTGKTKIATIYSGGGQIKITVVASGPDYEVTGREIKLSLNFVNTAENLAGEIADCVNYDVVARAIDNSKETVRIVKATQKVSVTEDVCG